MYHKTLKLKIFVFIVFSMLCDLSSAQVSWIKYAQNPVMIKQNLLTEFYAIGQPCAIMENDTFKMWYAACGIDHKGRILHAWSINGYTWNKYNNGAVIINVDSAGAWDDTWLDTPEIVHSPSGYFMYFFGDSVTDVQPNPLIPTTSAIGVATSSDGIHWNRYQNNPVLSKGDSLAWDNFWIESPAVLYDSSNGTYMMWYSGINKNWIIQTGLATSPDGLNWTKYAGNPVIANGLPGSYDDMWVAVPSVIKHNNHFEMWYNAFNSVAGWDTIYMCYATSPDGINWTKFTGNPLFHTYTPPNDTNIDKNGPWACDVVFDHIANNYKMWYETAAGFCYATSNYTTEMQNEYFLQNIYIIYPNPASDIITLNTANVNNEDLKINIYNITGDLVRSVKLKQNNLQINIRDLSNGLYFLEIISYGYSEKQKLIIQR